MRTDDQVLASPWTDGWECCVIKPINLGEIYFFSRHVYNLEYIKIANSKIPFSNKKKYLFSVLTGGRTKRTKGPPTQLSICQSCGAAFWPLTSL